MPLCLQYSPVETRGAIRGCHLYPSDCAGTLGRLHVQEPHGRPHAFRLWTRLHAFARSSDAREMPASLASRRTVAAGASVPGRRTSSSHALAVATAFREP